MQWQQIKDDWYWDAPPSEITNKRLYGIPLPELAQRILHPRKSEGPVFGKLELNTLAPRGRRLTAIDDFILHGIRHLVETKMAGLRELRDDGR